MKMSKLTETEFDRFSQRYSQPNLTSDMPQELPQKPNANERLYPDDLHYYCMTCLKLEASWKDLVYFLLGRGSHKNVAHLTHEYYRIHEPKKRAPRKSKAKAAAAQADATDANSDLPESMHD